jgi:hypothetical protein
MRRQLALILVGCYTVVVVVLSVLLLQASPGPSDQALHGVAIGTHGGSGGVAYMSGRRLRCRALEHGSAGSSECVITVAGRPLTLRASRNAADDPNQFGGTCEASYDGRSWPCRISWRHVHTPWFAYLDEPLDLSASQIEALRQQYWVENIPEGAVIRLIPVSIVLATVVAAVSAALWLWPAQRSRLLALSVVGTAGLLAFIGSSIATLYLTAPFWD